MYDAPSFGMHESQSRFFENIVGRNRAFTDRLLSEIQKHFGLSRSVSGEEFYRYLNEVNRTFIRTESDEVTYNLHIIIRFEIERELFQGNLKVADLPHAWADRYQKNLGVKPTHLNEGVLQDVHWAWGSFAYFPSYTIGNLISAQLSESMKSQFTVEQCVKNNQLPKVKDWLKENVHQLGHRYSALEVVKRATGKELSARPFIDYLKAKYL
jgi:carboxypeptidase Taq